MDYEALGRSCWFSESGCEELWCHKSIGAVGALVAKTIAHGKDWEGLEAASCRQLEGVAGFQSPLSGEGMGDHDSFASHEALEGEALRG